MPTWDQKTLSKRASGRPPLKVFSIAVPIDQHEDFKKLVNRVTRRHQHRRPDDYTHDAVRAALEAFERRGTEGL